MKQWSADFTNDPFNDYELMIEILYNDKEIAVIKQVNKEWIINWYSNEKDILIPFEWLYSLLTEANDRLKLNG